MVMKQIKKSFRLIFHNKFIMKKKTTEVIEIESEEEGSDDMDVEENE